MTFGEDWGWGAPPEECRRIFDAYAEAGGNVIDTAVNYTDGASERIVGELLGSERDHFVVSTKFTLSTDPDDPNASGSHRKNLVRSLELSLRRLGTDRIDVYWVHIWDPNTPVEETMRALDDAVRAGKVLYIGVSDTPAWVVSRANTLAEWRGWSPLVAIQVPYSLIQRDVERELLPMAESAGMSVAAWSPLAGGILSGKFTRPQIAPGASRVAAGTISERDLAIAGDRPGRRRRSRCHAVAGGDRVDDGTQPGGAPDRRRHGGSISSSTTSAPSTATSTPSRCVGSTTPAPSASGSRTTSSATPPASCTEPPANVSSREGADHDLPDRPHRRPGHAGQLVPRPRTRRARRR